MNLIASKYNEKCIEYVESLFSYLHSPYFLWNNASRYTYIYIHVFLRVKPIQLTRPLRHRAHRGIKASSLSKSRSASSSLPATAGCALATKYTSSPNGIINHSLNGEISRRRSRFYAASLQNAYTPMH